MLVCKQLLACLRQEWSELSSPSSTAMGCGALGAKCNISCVGPFALCPLAECRGRLSPCAIRGSVVTRAAIISATGDLCATSPSPSGPLPNQTFPQHSFSILPLPALGQTLDLPHTLPAEARSTVPHPDTPRNPGIRALPVVGTPWGLVTGVWQHLPGRCSYLQACFGC